MVANPPEETFDQGEFDENDLGEVQIEATAWRKRLFSKELRCMMYGFGDDHNPYTESVDLLEDLVIEFITEMTHRAMEIGRTGRVQVEDIIFLVRKDARKYSRVKDLLTMSEELKRARKAFDEIKYVGAEAKIKEKLEVVFFDSTKMEVNQRELREQILSKHLEFPELSHRQLGKMLNIHHSTARI